VHLRYRAAGLGGPADLRANLKVLFGSFSFKKKNYKPIKTEEGAFLDHPNRLRLAGALAGAVNGIFGGGGGMVLLPLLGRWGNMDSKSLFATCVAVIFPICLVSTTVYFTQTDLSLLSALPYLLGGVAGGLVGGLTFRRVPVKWLKLLFAGFLLYGGVRYLL